MLSYEAYDLSMTFLTVLNLVILVKDRNLDSREEIDAVMIRLSARTRQAVGALNYVESRTLRAYDKLIQLYVAWHIPY